MEKAEAHRSSGGMAKGGILAYEKVQHASSRSTDAVMTKKQQPAIPQLGKQAPLYRFFLNPYRDMRCTKCPQCDTKMHQRKLPLVIHIEPRGLLSLNKTCRYCPQCDLLIAHQYDVEQILLAALSSFQAKSIGRDDYLMVGTLEKAVWRRGMQQPLTLQETVDALHDFKEVVTFKVTGGWMPRNPDSRSSTRA